MSSEKIVQVGIGVFIIRKGQFLMGLRKGSHGEGDWSLPGGHLEYGEEWDVCGCREVLEETGSNVSNVKFLSVTNDIFEKENKHYVTIFLTSDWVSGEPKVLEPEKCERWSWFTFSNIPVNIFLPVRNLIEGRRQHKGFSEVEQETQQT